jgi:hypothetical protein
MAVDNIGGQTILFDFANPGTSEFFNKLNHKVIQPGIYDGMALSVNLLSNTIELTTGVMYIASDADKSNYISTSEAISWSPSGGWPSATPGNTINVAVYWLFTWANIVVNWAELQATELPASLPDNAVIVGTVVIDDTGSLVSASNLNRTYGINKTNYLGNLTDLATSAQTTLVEAINEVNAISTFVRNLSYGRSINIPDLSIFYNLPFTSFRLSYVEVGDNPKSIVSDGTYLWTTNYTANTLTRFNPFSGSTDTYNTLATANPIDITFDGTNIWIVNSNLNSISKIDPTTGNILGSITVGTLPVAIVYAENHLYIVNKNSHNVSKIHKDGSSVLSIIDLQESSDNPFPTDIVYTGTNLYVACPASLTGYYLKEINILSEAINNFSIAENINTLTFDGVYIWGAGPNNIIKWDTPADVVDETIVNAGVNKLFHNGHRLWYSKANEVGCYRDVIEGAPILEYQTTIAGNPYALTDDGTHIWVTMEGVGQLLTYRILK